MDIVKHKEPAYPPEDWTDDEEEARLINNTSIRSKRNSTAGTALYPTGESFAGTIQFKNKIK
jgi:hypothetical protein